MKLLLCIVVAVTCLHMVNSQSQCTRELLGDNAVVEPLIAASLVAGSQTDPPTITLIASNVVCLAADTVPNRYRSASLVIQYNCDGSSTICGTADANEVLNSQIELGCTANAWSHTVTGTPEGNIGTPPTATLTTELREDCAFCLANSREPSSQDPHHCVPCSENCYGLDLCNNIGDDGCCNVISAGQCRGECSAQTVPDPTFTCRVNCSDAPPEALYQTVTYDDPSCTYEGCTATYRCYDGLTLANRQTSYQLTCVRRNNILAEWDGAPQPCSETCSFPSREGSMANVTYLPAGCNDMFNPTACSAQYTCFNRSAGCNCTVNEMTGSVGCLSNSVTELLNSCEEPSDKGIDIIIIVVPIIVVGVLAIVALGILIGVIIYCCYCKKK